MKDFDILFTDETETKKRKKVSESIFEDLSFDNIKKAIFTEPEDDELYKNFIEVLKFPLDDIAKIKERQLVLKDCVKDPNLPNNLYEICMRAKKRRPQVKRESIYQSIQSVNGWEKLMANLFYSRELFDIAESINRLLNARTFYSESLNNMKEYFQQTKKLKFLQDKIEESCTILDTKYSSMNIIFSSSMNTQNAKITSVTRPEKPKSQTTQNKFSFFGKSGKKNDAAQESNPDRTYYANTMITWLSDEIMDRNVLFLTQMLTTINSAMLNMFSRIANQLLFYQAALKIVKFYEKHLIYSAFPEFDKFAQKNGIVAEQVYDLSFFTHMAYTAAKKAEEERRAIAETKAHAPKTEDIDISENDDDNEVKPEKIDITDNNFTTEESDIFFITGPNQGGKTTFLRSIGIAQLFAQAGLPVPAKKYICGAFSSIMTHFPKLEDDNLDYGKLAEELTRIKEDFPMTKDGSLILFNESFATTTAKEGIDIASDVITAMSKSDSVIIFVTHLYELALDADNLALNLFPNPKIDSSRKIINLIAQYKAPSDDNSHAERTYKIIQGTPQKQVFAIDLVRI